MKKYFYYQKKIYELIEEQADSVKFCDLFDSEINDVDRAAFEYMEKHFLSIDSCAIIDAHKYSHRIAKNG